MPGPIATQGSLHVCPMCSGPVPHVGGPIIGPGAVNILINNKPAALMGDMCICIGPPDVIAQGAANVFFNGVPVVCQGDITAHGGVITQGEPNVILGTSSPSPTQTMAKHKIPFPKITLVNRLLGNAKEAIVNQTALAEAAPVFEEEEDSEEVTLETTLAQDQLHILAKSSTLNSFLMYLIAVFGKDIPSKAYEELYNDAKNNTIPKPTILVKPSIPYGGKALFYNNKIKQEIWVGEQIIRDASEKNAQSGELMVVLIEEYGHYIDYLLRNHYAETERKDALRDEGAYFSYKMLELNSLDQKDQYYADATIEGVQHTLTWDFEPYHKSIKEYVNEERRTSDDNFGPFEFYKAGFLDKEGEFAHGDIELKGLSKSLEKSGLNKNLKIIKEDYKDYLLKIYFGNWKRDFSQGLDPLIIRVFSNGLAAFAEDASGDSTYLDVVKRFDINKLKSNTLSESETVKYDINFFGTSLWSATFSPVDVSVKMICTILEMLAAKEFVHAPLEKKGFKTNINYAQHLATLKKDFSAVDRANLGVYVPAEHIDNPAFFENNNDDNILLPEFVGDIINTQSPSLHDLNMEFGMKNYIRSAISTNNKPGEEPKKNRYVNSHVYILDKLKAAAIPGGHNIENQIPKDNLGAALHTLEDFFAHSNYAEIALIKEGELGVFPWITKVPGKIDYLKYIKDLNYRSHVNNNSSKYNVVNALDTVGITNSNLLTTKIPLVTGTFGMIDTMASLLPIVAHSFDYDNRKSQNEINKQKERAKREEDGSFYYKDNINSRSFAEVLFLEFLKDLTNDKRDTDEETDSVSVKTFKETLSARDTVYEKMQEASNSGHEFFEELPEWFKSGARKARDEFREGSDWIGDKIDATVDKLLEPFYGVMYNFLQLVASNLNDLQVAQASEITRLEEEADKKTWDLKIGINPTHTQVAKDDPHHPMHTLSAKLAIEAVSKVGTAVFNVWQGNKNNGGFENLKEVVNEIMKHPAQTSWQSETVKTWIKNNRELVCKASKPSITIDRLLHVNEEIRELINELQEIAKKPAFKKINEVREKLYKEANESNQEAFLSFENNLTRIKKLITNQEKRLIIVQAAWDTQFPEPILCRLNGPVYNYTVKRDDTLSSIVSRSEGKTSLKELLELNPSIDPGTKVIYTGYDIKVPYPITPKLSLTLKKRPFLD